MVSPRPFTTLFLMMSVDGKISTGSSEAMDVDKDFPLINGLKEGLKQYYDLEKQTDLFSLNTGRVLAKTGVNQRIDTPVKLPVSFVVIDSKPHLTADGILYLSRKTKNLILATTNPFHPAFGLQETLPNLHILQYSKKIDFNELLATIRSKFDATAVTIQSGGTLNSTLLELGLIDRVLLIVAPALIGGKETPTLVDGHSMVNPGELFKIKTLTLVQAMPLQNSYLLLEYLVLNEAKK